MRRRLGGHDVVMAPSGTTYLQLLADADAGRRAGRGPNQREPGHEGLAVDARARVRSSAARPARPQRPPTSSAARGRSGPSTSRPPSTSTRCCCRGSPRSRTRCGAGRRPDESSFVARFAAQRRCSTRAAFATSSSRRSGCRGRRCSSRAESLALAPARHAPRRRWCGFTLDGSDRTPHRPSYDAPRHAAGAATVGGRAPLPSRRAARATWCAGRSSARCPAAPPALVAPAMRS